MKYFLVTPLLIYVVATLWANYDLFPEGFMQYWWFDDLGHVMVFGSVAFVTIITATRYQLPMYLGTLCIAALAIIDEFSQLLLTHRAFSHHDLLMSLVGITLATIVMAIYYATKKKSQRLLE